MLQSMSEIKLSVFDGCFESCFGNLQKNIFINFEPFWHIFAQRLHTSEKHSEYSSTAPSCLCKSICTCRQTGRRATQVMCAHVPKRNHKTINPVFLTFWGFGEPKVHHNPIIISCTNALAAI